MKRYYNATTKEWYNEGQSLTKRVENGVFTGIPSEEQLTAWGFVEWVEPEPTPQQLLEQAKQRKIAEIEVYDASDAVNGFIIRTEGGDITEWLDTEKRNNAFRAIDSAKKLDDESISFAIGDIPVTLSVTTAEIYLARVEKYAVTCTNVTARHKAAINALGTVEAVEWYDYRTGYPEKLIFSL
jgi:hypothetical protein